MSETVNLSDSDVLANHSNNDRHQFWQEAVSLQQSSGLNIGQFCRREGLSEASFYFWRKRLSNLSDGKPPVSIQESKKPSFVEVNLPKSSFEPLILEIAGLGTLKLSNGFDSSVLKQVLKVIKELDKC